MNRGRIDVIAPIAACATLALILGCAGSGGVEVPGREGALKRSAGERAERRAYDGAPPVIPHDNFGIDCISCHDGEGMEVADVGFAPPSPHAGTSGMSAMSRCTQCHVFKEGEGVFRASAFVGLAQDLRPGGRLYDGAPPTLPHPILMRENCAACHSGPAAREEIRCTHPERTRCTQCHVPVATREPLEM